MFSPQTHRGLHSKRVTAELRVSPAGIEDADRTEELEELERSLVVLSLKRAERKTRPNGTDLNLLLILFVTLNDFIHPSWKEPTEIIHSNETSEKVKALSRSPQVQACDVSTVLISVIAKSYKTLTLAISELRGSETNESSVLFFVLLVLCSMDLMELLNVSVFLFTSEVKGTGLRLESKTT